MADIAKSGTAPVNNPLVTAAHGQGPRPLGEGDSGADVLALQKQLAALGFNPGTPDGKLGAHTVEAIINFQNSKGLAPDGKVGPETRGKLASAAPVKHTDAVEVSKQAAGAAGTAGVHHDIMKYPLAGATEPAAKAAPVEHTRLEDQQEAARNTLNSLAHDAKVAGIIAIPIFTPVALAIAAQADYNTIKRFEMAKGDDKKLTMAEISADEHAKAAKAILALPGKYAQTGMDGLNYIKDGALTGAGIISSAAVTGWNNTVDGVASAYNTVADYSSQALTQAEESGGKLVDAAKKDAKAGWHWSTTPLRSIGKWLSTLGGN
jgi:peptidoglycan hydrolase-like protein with peptidoglycan-binding domain